MTDQLVIPYQGEARDIYAVYFDPGAHRAPSPRELDKAAARWRDDHLEDPLKQAMAEFAKSGLVSIGVQPVSSMPEIPIPLLRHLGMGELEERVVQSAKHVVVVVCQDLNMPPRAGLWTGLASALGIAELLDGVLFDPDALRIIDRQAAAKWFSPMGLVSAARHIIVPFSVGDSGLGWMTTRGLQKFGLPDLELKDVPPQLQRLSILLNAVAQFLIEAGFRATAKVQGGISSLLLDREVTIDPNVIHRASGEPPEDVAADAEVTVGLHFDSTAGDFPFITITRPNRVLSDQGEWLYSVMKRLIPVDDVPHMVSSESDEMTAAHERAVAELPQIRARFQAGLEPGEVLMIKHGFPTSHDDREFMWVTVTKWRDGKISGQLSNIPNDVPSLSIGHEVTIPESEVFDWVLLLAHGGTEGGYTNEVAIRGGQGG